MKWEEIQKKVTALSDSLDEFRKTIKHYEKNRRCETCVYYFQSHDPDSKGMLEFCRRNPPSAYNEFGWDPVPKFPEQRWCGEWTMKS